MEWKRNQTIYFVKKHFANINCNKTINNNLLLSKIKTFQRQNTDFHVNVRNLSKTIKIVLKKVVNDPIIDNGSCQDTSGARNLSKTNIAC